MRFLLTCAALAFLVQPGSPIEIGVWCDCSATELDAVRRAGFNALFPPDARDVIRVRVREWPGPGARDARLALWKAIAGGARRVGFDAGGGVTRELLTIGETAGVITRNQALFRPLAAHPDLAKRVRVAPARAIAVHILESGDALVIIALNTSARTRRVKLTFPPEIPEAIWQNMEAGNAVNFVMEKTGPTHEHTFAPYDALVLAIRKKLR